MTTILLVAIAFVVCSCSPEKEQSDNYPSKYPNTPTMGDVDRASAGTL